VAGHYKGNKLKKKKNERIKKRAEKIKTNTIIVQTQIKKCAEMAEEGGEKERFQLNSRNKVKYNERGRAKRSRNHKRY